MDSFLRGILHKINRLFISKYANHFFACTELAGEWFYSKKIRASKNYRLIPNAIDTEKFLFSEKARCELREEWGIENELVIGNIGRLHSQKNQGFLLEIFSEILKKRDARLVICGDGEEKENLQNKAEALGISDKILFLGVRSDVQRLYSAFDVFLLPSLYEGLGIVLIEAQASGLPSFASAEVIPEDARVSEQLKFIPLEKSPALWAEEIINSNLSRKNNTQADIINKGYDINSQIDSLQKFFETEV
jgi:glycosyltransferase involved in cell wall biosynthesis